jgi:hypothetical protein
MIFFSRGAGGDGAPTVIRYGRIGTVVQQRDTRALSVLMGHNR